ncbi:hypothetical protein AAF712_011871 [Marasmius tenuissimus]|uniref:Uncharacterized protein n=1 Tax=Marasmius tenuissimus TaxID=585030 RepID=A0ABR2ZJ89_9AGAR
MDESNIQSKRDDYPVALAPDTGTTSQQSPHALEIGIRWSKPMPPVPSQTDPQPSPPPPPPIRKSFTSYPTSISSKSPASSIIGNTGYSAKDTTSETTGRKRASISTQTRDSSRYSRGSESFHTAPPSRASLDTVKSPAEASIVRRLSGMEGSSRPLSRYSHQREPSNTQYTPRISLDNSHSEHNEGEEEEEEEEEEEQEEEELSNSHSTLAQPTANSPSSISDHANDVPFTPHSAGTPVHGSPSPSTENYPPSSFIFPLGRTHSPIVRPATAASGTTTAPPYSPGPYRQRRDTSASSQTYETLPSYHSRRSTQTLTDMALPTTTHNFRSLPPLPPLPPFISLSSILLTPSFAASPSSSMPNTPNTPALPEREEESTTGGPDSDQPERSD